MISNRKIESYYDISFGVSTLIIAIFGLVGNILVICVYCRQRFSHNSLRLYFVSISITHSMNLLLGVQMFLQNTLNLNYSLSSYYAFVCKLSDYFDYLFPSMSAWTLVMIGFDRMMSVVFPRKLTCLNVRLFQALVLVGIYACNMVIYMPTILYKEIVIVKQNGTVIETDCNYKEKPKFLEWIDLVNLTILPFSLMASFSLTTIIHVIKSRRKIKQALSRQCSVYALTRTKRSKRLSVSKDKQFIFNSITLNLLYLLLTLPILILGILWNYEDDISVEDFVVLVTIIVDMFFLNYAMLFWISLASNSVFRREFIAMIKLRQSKTASSINVNNNNKSSIVPFHSN